MVKDGLFNDEEEVTWEAVLSRIPAKDNEPSGLNPQELAEMIPEGKELVSDYKKTSPAKTLPEGWRWFDYYDGTGFLAAPDAEAHLSYCALPEKARVAYYYSDNVVKMFAGSLDEFKVQAEAMVEKKVLSQRPSLDSLIAAAKSISEQAQTLSQDLQQHKTHLER